MGNPHGMGNQMGNAPWAYPILYTPALNPKPAHLLVHRLLSCCALNEDYYDLIDVDSFGSDTSFLGAAIETVRWAKSVVSGKECSVCGQRV